LTKKERYMATTPLPVCRWRREPMGDKRHTCISPRIASAPSGIWDHQCIGCPHRDHEGPLEVPNLVPEAGEVRHLLYFCYPLGEVWKWNLAQLKQRLSLFNGLRRMVVATSLKTASLEEVKAEMGDFGGPIVGIPNDGGLREMAAFPSLLASLERYQSPADATFYAHAKGVTSEAWAPPVRQWTTAMLQCLLDHWPAVERELKRKCMVGIFRRIRRMGGPVSTPWHYSGSFRWWRNRDLYSRAWRTIPLHWLAGELSAGLLFRREETACLCGEFGSGNLGLYLPETWERWASGCVADWKGEHMADKQSPLLLTCVIASHEKPQYVHDAIQSVIDQTSDSWQLIVIDSGRCLHDGEFDRYMKNPRIVLMESQEASRMPVGYNPQAWVHNRVIHEGKVRGDLICFLSDDDVYAPGAFSQWIDAARKHPEQSAWVAPMEVCNMDADGVLHTLYYLPRPKLTRPVRQLDCKADGGQVCVRTAICPDWPLDKADQWHGDGIWLDRIGERCEIHPLPEACGVHRHTPISTFTRREE
jgi:hypothetical protein